MSPEINILWLSHIFSVLNWRCIKKTLLHRSSYSFFLDHQTALLDNDYYKEHHKQSYYALTCFQSIIQKTIFFTIFHVKLPIVPLYTQRAKYDRPKSLGRKNSERIQQENSLIPSWKSRGLKWYMLACQL